MMDSDGERYDSTGVTPIPTNTRYAANIAMEKAKEFEPWFGIEQEYTLFTLDKV